MDAQAQDVLGIGGLSAGLPPSIRGQAKPYFDMLNKSEGRINKIEADRDTRLKEAHADRKVAADSLQSSVDAEPTLQPLPQLPPYQPKDISDGFGLLLTLASLSGLASREPLTASLNAMGGMMKGLNEGNKDVFDRHYKEYEANFKTAQEMNKETLRKYDRVIASKKMSISEKDEAIRLIKVETGNQVGQELRKQHGYGEAMHHVETLRASVEKAREFDIRMQEVKAQHEAKNAQKAASNDLPAGFTQEAVDYYARQTIAGDQSWRTGLSRSKTGAAIIAAVDSRIPVLATGAGISPEQASTTKDVRHSISSALNDRQKYVAVGNQFVANFKKQADLVEKYLEPGLAGETPAFNRWIQAGRKAIAGDADVTNLDVAIRGLAREHQRIVTGVTSNAQLHASAQETADELLNRAMNESQVRGALGVMREEAENALSSGKDEVSALKESLNHIGIAGTLPATKNAKGWVLHTDAKGNKAYVSPDGNEFEEVR